MQLSAQSILMRCIDVHTGMIQPFAHEKVVVNGKSAGLSAASYDMRIGHDLEIGVNPALILQQHLLVYGQTETELLRRRLKANPTHTSLAYTLEDLFMPDDVSAQVCDKSTYARMFLSAYNTFVDPGFKGNLTLELINHGPEPISLKTGDPIVQLMFTQLDETTDRPYAGKYQHQVKAAHGPRFEECM